MLRRTRFVVPTFNKNTLNVSGKNTLIKTVANKWRVAIAAEPIDAKVDGKKMFCVRVDNSGCYSELMFGFTTMATFDSNTNAYFGNNGFTGAGLGLEDGDLWRTEFDANTNESCFGVNNFNGTGMFLCNRNLFYPVTNEINIIDDEISENANEIIVILTISNNGKKKQIRFLCDGVGSKTKDVSEHLNRVLAFPAIVLGAKNLQVTT
jgi:hypothetical protein